MFAMLAQQQVLGHVAELVNITSQSFVRLPCVMKLGLLSVLIGHQRHALCQATAEANRG